VKRRRAAEGPLAPVAERRALSTRLRNVDLTLECQLCGHLIVKKGGWFMTISTVKCPVCKGERRLTYPDKLALFAKHGQLT
jgi:phage FluMu protein Com